MIQPMANPIVSVGLMNSLSYSTIVFVISLFVVLLLMLIFLAKKFEPTILDNIKKCKKAIESHPSQSSSNHFVDREKF